MDSGALGGGAAILLILLLFTMPKIGGFGILLLAIFLVMAFKREEPSA